MEIDSENASLYRRCETICGYLRPVAAQECVELEATGQDQSIARCSESANINMQSDTNSFLLAIIRLIRLQGRYSLKIDGLKSL